MNWIKQLLFLFLALVLVPVILLADWLGSENAYEEDDPDWEDGNV